MKTYTIEFTAYVNVEAEDEHDACEKAWDVIAEDEFEFSDAHVLEFFEPGE